MNKSTLDEKKNSINSTKKIIVCGGGLVGCMAACYFAQRNFDVELYEYRSDIRTSDVYAGRSINMTLINRGIKALERIGCDKSIIDKSIPIHSRMLHDIKGEMTPMTYDVHGKCMYSIDRRYINEVLLNSAESYTNVKINFQHKLRCALGNGEAVFYDIQNNKEITKKYDLIVGCDGAYSAVRQSLLKERPIDFSQKYINTHYLELRIPARKSDGDFALPANYFHLWPRGDFMLIALANQDRSFTCTLFMPLDKFNAIKDKNDLNIFFETHFSDAYKLFDTNQLAEMFFAVKPSSLISIKCNPHHGNKCILLGDAAHAMVPFSGQGMNCGFEDCVVFFQLLDKFGFENIDHVLETYSLERISDTNTIADIAMKNYDILTQSVTKSDYKLRKKIDEFLYGFFPNYWIPHNTMLNFSIMRYTEIEKRRMNQNKILNYACTLIIGTLTSSMCYLGYKFAIMQNVFNY